MVVLGQKTQSGWWWQVMHLPFLLKPFLKPIGMDLFKKGKEKVRICIRNRLSIFTNKKMQKMHSKHTLFDEHAWLCSCMHPCRLSSLPVSDAQKKGEKRRLTDWEFFSCTKWPKKKMQKSMVKLTFEPQKGPKTPEQSTKNVDMCEISTRWERKKAKE